MNKLNKNLIYQQQGLSLLELLVTVSILAAIAGIGTTFYRPAIDDAANKAAQAEMVAIIKALKRFKKDTGYYPKQGPFALSGTGIGQVDLNSIPLMDSGDSSGSPAYSNVMTYWFNSPANFWQLYQAPIKDDSTGEQVMPWAAETGRGWNGPYLQHISEFVDIGNSLSILDVNDPLDDPKPQYGIQVGVILNSGTLKNLYAIADPFINNAVEVVNEVDGDELLMDWHHLHTLSAGYDPDLHDQTRYGSPYLLLYKNTKPRLISMGVDGKYGGVNAYDECVRGSNDPQNDDLVICFN